MIKDQMNKIYKDMAPDKIPWNMETPPEILQSLTRNHILRPCKLIELGCGAGNYVIYFSKTGFDATGVDISENAIEMARKSALKTGAKCKFIVADVLGDMSEIKDQYDFAYDWELLHHIFPADRERYVDNVYRLLNPEGRYLSVCFSEESAQFGGAWKYRKTPLDTILYFSNEAEIGSLFKKCFVIEDLKTIEIMGKYAPHKAVYAMMKKKNG